MRRIAKLFSTILVLCLIFGSVSLSNSGESIQFTWDPNSEADLAGYRLFERQESGSYSYSNPKWEGATNLTPVYLSSDWTDGVWYFVVRAFDTHGNESEDSNEVSLEIDNIAPAPPTGCATVVKIE